MLTDDFYAAGCQFGGGVVWRALNDEPLCWFGRASSPHTSPLLCRFAHNQNWAVGGASRAMIGGNARAFILRGARRVAWLMLRLISSSLMTSPEVVPGTALTRLEPGG